MRVTIEVDTLDRQLGFDLFGPGKSLGPGVSTELPGDATLTLERLHIRKAIAVPETLQLVLTFGGGIATGLVANWLYDKLKGKAKKVRIDRVEIQLDEGEIKRILTESIEREQ